MNLSHLGHYEKAHYIQQHLPLVAKYRRRRGYPHRILLDECHYFLNWPDHEKLLDPELDSYTLVTYRPSQLMPNVLRSVHVLAVTGLAQRQEVDAIRQLVDADAASADWYEPLANLGITEAALLPPTEEAQGRLRRFCVAPRLTQHVRHRTKYFDIPVANDRAFVFTDKGWPLSESASTLSELAMSVSRVAPHVVQDHLRRHDLSTWIADVVTIRLCATLCAPPNHGRQQYANTGLLELLVVRSLDRITRESNRNGKSNMIKWLLRVLGIATDKSELEEYEPIYGLPRRSLDEWLARNPELRKDYEAKLLARSLRSRSVHN